MKKVLALLVACFMVLGARLAMADTRTDSLGLTAGQQIDDLDSIWLFPQDAANYGNVADFRVGGLTADDSWGGIIHKDWDDVGYIGIYTNRPFNQNNGVTPNVNPANQNGILNGFTDWAQMVNPASSSYWGSNYLYDPDQNIGGHYAYYPFGEVALNYYQNFENGAGLNIIKIADPQNLADIFWAKDFSDVTLGAHFNYAAQRGGNSDGANYGSGTASFNPATPAGGDNTASVFNLDSQVLGLDLGLTSKSLGLALGLGYSIGSVNYKESYTYMFNATTSENWYSDSLKDSNISELRVNALLKNKINDTTTGRIYANARLDNLGFSQSSDYDQNGDDSLTDAGDIYTSKSAYTDTNVNLGIACDHNVADGKAHVIAGLGIIYDGRKWTQSAFTNLNGSTTANQILAGSGSSYSEDWWVVPANVAVEAPLFSWLKARVGASHDLYSNITGKVIQLTNVNTAGTAFQDTTTVINNWNLATLVDMSYGLSAEFQNFTLDLQVNPNTLQQYLTTFQPGAGIFTAGVPGLFTQADIRYAF